MDGTVFLNDPQFNYEPFNSNSVKGFVVELWVV